jgi:hypothetical protein
MMKPRTLPTFALALALFASSGCKMQEDGAATTQESTDTPATTAHGSGTPAGGARVIIDHPPPAGEVAPIVKDELAKAQRDGRRLVVYEGAKWCQPCQQLHKAIENGELDATFPELTLLEFDADRDGERLLNAGYQSRYIPLLALPNAQGLSSGKQIEGGVKGDGTVALITKKLRGLLAAN